MSLSPKSLTPILIGGCSRSGTTFLGAILGSHSECVVTPESQFKMNAYRDGMLRVGSLIDSRAVLQYIANHWRFRHWGVDLDIRGTAATLRDESYGAILDGVVKAYAEHVGKPDFSIWVDHTPNNISYLHTLFGLFHNAKCIHLVRDGRAIASSILRLDWGPSTVPDAANWWLQALSYGLAAELTYGPDRVMRVRFEDLVKSPEVESRRICSWLGIEYEAEMTEAGGFVVPRYSAEQHRLVGRAAETGRAEGWKAELKPRQIEVFELITGNMLTYLGYEVQYGIGAAPRTRTERVLDLTTSVWKDRVLNRVRGHLRRRAAQ